MYTTNLTLQTPYGLNIPISAREKQLMGAIAERYLLCQTNSNFDLNKSDDKKRLARHFAHRIREELALIGRGGISLGESAVLEEFGRSLFLDIAHRASEPTSPKRLLAQLLLDEVDWHFPTRYAAYRWLESKTRKEGLSPWCGESEFLELEHSGKVISAERMSEAFYLFGLSVFTRPYLGRHRLIIQNNTYSHNDDSKQDADVSNSLKANMHRFLVNGLADPLQEPLGILVPLQSHSKPTRLVPIHTWRSKASASNYYSKLIEAARDKLAEKAGTKLEKIQVEDTKSREILSDKLALPSDNANYAILTSLLDLGSPLLDHAACLFVRFPADDSCPAVSASFREPLPEDKNTAKLFTATLEDKIEMLHTYEISTLDLFFAHADIAALLAKKHFEGLGSTKDDSDSVDKNLVCVNGPLPRALGLGGIQSCYLFLYLIGGLKVAQQKQNNEA